MDRDATKKSDSAATYTVTIRNTTTGSRPFVLFQPTPSMPDAIGDLFAEAWIVGGAVPGGSSPIGLSPIAWSDASVLAPKPADPLGAADLVRPVKQTGSFEPTLTYPFKPSYRYYLDWGTPAPGQAAEVVVTVSGAVTAGSETGK